MATKPTYVTLREAAESLGVHEQGIGPLVSVSELAAPEVWVSDEEIDLFNATVRTERDHDR